MKISNNKEEKISSQEVLSALVSASLLDIDWGKNEGENESNVWNVIDCFMKLHWLKPAKDLDQVFFFQESIAVLYV